MAMAHRAGGCGAGGRKGVRGVVRAQGVGLASHTGAATAPMFLHDNCLFSHGATRSTLGLNSTCQSASIGVWVHGAAAEICLGRTAPMGAGGGPRGKPIRA